MKLFELLQLLNTEIDGIPSPVQQPAQTQPQQSAPAQIVQPQQPAQAQPVSVAVAEQADGMQEYGGLEKLLRDVLAGQQNSTAAVNQLTTAMQAAQVGMGIQSKPAAVTSEAATARVINPMYGKEVK